MTVGPIPWSAVLQWCSYHGLSREMTRHVHSVIRIVDEETLRRATLRMKGNKKPRGDS